VIRCIHMMTHTSDLYLIMSVDALGKRWIVMAKPLWLKFVCGARNYETIDGETMYVPYRTVWVLASDVSIMHPVNSDPYVIYPCSSCGQQHEQWLRYSEAHNIALAGATIIPWERLEIRPADGPKLSEEDAEAVASAMDVGAEVDRLNDPEFFRLFCEELPMPLRNLPDDMAQKLKKLKKKRKKQAKKKRKAFEEGEPKDAS
jgi:hypothetical protein